MTFRGRVAGNTIILDEPTGLPEGTVVEVKALNPPNPKGATFLERLGDIVGSVDGMPEDFAENHDHYIHGAPKR